MTATVTARADIDRRRPLARRRRRAARTAWLLLTPFMIVFLASIVFPLIYAVVISFFKRQLVGGTSFVGLGNYLRALGRSAAPRGT